MSDTSRTVRVRIEADEQYPVYNIYEDSEEIEIPVELLERYQRLYAEWDELQTMLKKLHHEEYERWRASLKRS